MKRFYLNVERIGNEICERFVENGTERIVSKKYSPTLFIHSEQGDYLDIYDKPCKAKKFDTMYEASQWIKQMKDIGLEVLGQEDFRLAYISDMYKGQVKFDQSEIRVCNIDIEVTAPEFPFPDEAKYPIDLLTHYDSIDDKYYVFDLLSSPFGDVAPWDSKIAGLSEDENGDEIPQEVLEKVVYNAFSSEKELLKAYIKHWKKKPPAILTGWNIEGFDIPYIINRIRNLFGEDAINHLSPFDKISQKTVQTMYGSKTIFSIHGMSVLDYLDLYKKFSFTNHPTYKLDYVAEFETGKGKLKYEGPISKLRELNHQRYVSYNIIDVHTVQEIDKIRGFITLSISMAYYAKMNIDSVMSPIKTWDSIIFNSLKDQGKVVPETKSHVRQPYPGAYVKEPEARSYNYVVSLDATSLYPSVIMQANISPETIVDSFTPHPILDYVHKKAPKPSEEYSCTPNGIMYTKEKRGVIPTEIEKVFKERKEWKGKMMAAQRNKELIKGIINGTI